MAMERLFRRQERKRERRDELLSAYLDDQLDSQERERLEAQLATDPALRAELEALRRTVALVRDFVPVPIPRNFILPRTMAARPRPAPAMRPRQAWAAPLLTAATAIVSLLFVVVLAGDLLLAGVGNMATAPKAPAQVEVEVTQLALEAPPSDEKVEAERVAPPMPTEAPSEAPLAATTEEEHYAVETPDDAEATSAAASGGGPTDEATDLTPTAVSEDDLRGAEPTPDEVAKSAPLAAGEEEAVTSEGEWEAREDEIIGPAPVSPWRALEVALGLIALGLAFSTIRAWRVRRR